MRMTRQFLMTSALVAALTVTGCKKDDPPPAPAPTADVEVAEKPATPEVAKPEKPATPEPKPDMPKEEVAVAPTGEFIDRAPLGMKSLATIPEKILGVGASASIKGLVESFARFQKGMPPNAFDTFLALAQRSTGLGDLTKISWDKPLYVVFPSPVAWDEGFIWVASVDGDFDVKTTFPMAAEADKGFKVELGPKTLFLNVVDSKLFIASHADLLVEFNDFLTKDLVAWVPEAPLQLEGSVENAMKVYAKEIAEAKAMMPMVMKQLEQQGGRAAQLQMMAKYSEQGLAMIEGIARIGLALDPNSDFPRLGLSASFKPDTDGAKFVADSAARRAKLATSVPADAWFAFAGSYDQSRTDEEWVEMQTMIREAYSEHITFADGELEAFVAELKRIYGVMGDQTAFWARVAGERPFSMESLSTTKDAAVARQATDALIGLIIDKLWGYVQAQASAELGSEGAKFKGDLKDVWPELLKLAEPFGVGLSTRTDEALLGAELTLDWSKLPTRNDPDAEIVKRLVGDKLQIAMGTKGDYFAASFGADGYARVGALLGQEEAKSTDKWLVRASERSWGVMTFNPGPLLKVISTWPDVAEMADALRMIPSLPIVAEGIANPTMLQVEIEVPVALIKAISGIFMTGGPEMR